MSTCTNAQETKIYFDNGQLKEVFKKSKDGKYVEHKQFRKNGKLIAVNTYENGKSERNFFDENKILKKSITVDNKKVITKDYNSQGVLIYEVTETDRLRNSKSFYQSGKIREERHYVNGRENGKSKHYFENGQLSSIKDELTGKIIVYDKNGKVVVEKNKVYYDGKLGVVESYNNMGKKDGEWRYFSETGHIDTTEMYKDGELNEVILYSESGKLDKVIKFKKGKEICRKRYFEDGTLYLHIEDNFYRKYAIDDSVYTDLNINLLIDVFLSEELIDGNYKSFYSNHQLQETGKYKDDKKEGEWKTYYENGQLEEIGLYKDDKKEGEWKTYYENGQLKKNITYKNDAKTRERKWHYENGQLEETGKYKDGLQEGEWKTYYKNGQLYLISNYKDGQQQGKIKSFFPNGQLIETGLYKDSKREGEWKTYYKNGQLKEIKIYKNGKRDGELKVYDKTGKLIISRTFKDGKSIGE